MQDVQVHIEVNPNIYIRNPYLSELGRKIVSASIKLINELGFEKLTFKKLGEEIKSPESSIYRYFENKHMLLVYLVSWYWGWIEYKLILATTNMTSPQQRLEEAIKVITEEIRVDNSFSHINEVLLGQVIISESVKAHHTKDVDQENEKGYFKTYKQVVQYISDIVIEINPSFGLSHMLVSTIIEGAHQQHYFSEHLPLLTDVEKGEDTIVQFYTDLAFKMIKE